MLPWTSITDLTIRARTDGSTHRTDGSNTFGGSNDGWGRFRSVDVAKMRARDIHRKCNIEVSRNEIFVKGIYYNVALKYHT